MKAAIDNTLMKEHGCVSIKLCLWIVKFEFHIIYMYHKILFFFSQPFKVVKTILGLHTLYLFIYFKKFIYLFIFGCVGLRCCARAFSSCGERGLLFVAVHGLLIAVASLVVEHGL